jgi:aspartyl-tRNA(Asn)/glutamyl-tRNA(Gln) amidotransferase subunit A
MELPLLDISTLSGLLRKGEVSPVELTRQTLARIERLQPRLNAYITVTADLAIEQARGAESEIRAGRWRGPLHGIPYAAKDLFFTKGIRTTVGSRVLADFIPDDDAAVVEKLRNAGAVLAGKAGMHEHAYGITNTNPHFGPVRNPWDIERIPGGSSGGSTAALATGQCGFSLGTDTGGSIRIPASFCGVTGLKPTFGRVSRYGCYPLAHTLDHVGPFALSCEEAWWVYAAMAGRDARDETTVERPEPAPDFAPEMSLRGRKIGVPKDFYFERLDPGVEAATRQALAVFESLGAVLTDVEVPDIEEANAVSRVILLAEAASIHQRTLDERYGDYGEDQRVLIDQGRFIPAADYLNAQRWRRGFCAAFNRILEEVDAIAAPAVPVPPAPIGETSMEFAGETHDVRLLTTRNVRALNLTGLPMLSIPCGFTPAGLPVGLMLTAALFDEKNLLEIGHAYQTASAWHKQRPPEV